MEPPALADSPYKWSGENATVHIAGQSQLVARGSQLWSNSSGALLGTSSFFVLPSLLSRKQVKQLRKLLKDTTPDMDSDSVDKMPTLELVLERNGSIEQAMELPGKEDLRSPSIAKKRQLMRKRVAAITQPIMHERITPFVRARYPQLCGQSAARACTPCHSIVRRYMPGERRTHDMHFDLHAAVTVVVSLSDYGTEHRGGLQIQAAGGATAQVLPLKRGDAVVHESDLQHGVRMPDDDGSRWSWILWYLDSERCDAFVDEWHRGCAESGSSLCQYLHSLRLGGKVRAELWEESTKLSAMVDASGAVINGDDASKLDKAKAAALVEAANWARLAAQSGLGRAMDHYAMLLRSGKGVAKDEVAASVWLRRAINASNEARAHCHLGQMLSEGTAFPTTPLGDGQAEALAHFRAAAHGGSHLCHYNVGVCHLSGSGGAVRDKELARRWFERANTGDAMHAAAAIHAEAGRLEEAERWLRRAESAGVASAAAEIARLKAHRAKMSL